MTKIVLLQEIADLGAADTVVDVSDGYARNFLMPRKLAVAATDSAIKAAESRKKANEAQREKEKDSLRETAKKIDNAQVTITMDAGEGGKLFGSVTHADIAKAAYGSLGVEVDKKKIVITDPIKTLGTFDVLVKFASDITATLKVNVAGTSK